MSIIRNLLSRAKNWFSEDNILLRQVKRALLFSVLMQLLLILLLVLALTAYLLYAKLFH
jgi:hypothetical protein